MRYFYLDFESNKANDLFLAGYSTGDDVKQVVLHDDLAPLAAARGLGYFDPKEFMTFVVHELAKNHRTLVAYSIAEKQMILKFCDQNDLKFGTTINYLNLRKCAKRWINQFHKDKFEALPDFRQGVDPYQRKAMKNSLASVMRLTSYQAPSDYAPGKTTARINSIRDGLAAKQKIFARLTNVQKQKATKFLKHNYFDVRAMIVLHNAIAQDSPRCLECGADEIVL